MLDFTGNRSLHINKINNAFSFILIYSNKEYQHFISIFLILMFLVLLLILVVLPILILFVNLFDCIFFTGFLEVRSRGLIRIGLRCLIERKKHLRMLNMKSPAHSILDKIELTSFEVDTDESKLDSLLDEFERYISNLLTKER